ncbi:hypothetical protein V5O48_004813 [Marasmius crinis-equi]|uniref:Enoyl reductase (ER) domain-containing protein n=1 Tax=Marasmius crinis-equi TaxID=585013 RepID=A0ABR3FP10_9AGAR
MSTQKALYLKEKHGAFVVSQRDIPVPGVGELLVKVHAAALNPIDWKIQEYGMVIGDDQYPAIIGEDVAGEVVRVGANRDGHGLVTGDRVLFQGQLNDFAGFQQFAKVSVDIAGKIPKSVTYSQAASVASGLSAAAIGLFTEAPRGAGLNPLLDESVKYPNQPALVVGGSSSVGQYAIQLLRYLEFSPIITYASARHSTYLKSLGATHVVDRKSVNVEDLPSEVKKIARKPVKIVFDAVSIADTQSAAYASLADTKGATLILVLPSLVREEPGSKKKVYFIHGSVAVPENRAFGKKLFRKIEQFLKDGTIVPNRVEELPNGLEGIQEGLVRLKEGSVSGLKLIALPQQTR